MGKRDGPMKNDIRDACSTAEKSDIRDVCSTAGKNDIRDVCSTADWHLGIPKILGDTQNFGLTRNIG